jgi:HAD superfamily hydrolase (TIGR01549 family)
MLEPGMGHRLASVFFDLGDTLMDEGSEVKIEDGTTTQADLLPGAAEMLRRFRGQGLRLALVADARPQTPYNVLGRHGLLDVFEYLAISEVTGASKPDPRIFLEALEALHIPRSHYGSVVMVGNNLERDIAGANRLGLISVFLHWTERRRTAPLAPDEQPRYTVHSIAELEALIDGLDG